MTSMKQLYEQKSVIEQQIVTERLKDTLKRDAKRTAPHYRFDDVNFSHANMRINIDVLISDGLAGRKPTFEEILALSEHVLKLLKTNPLPVEDLFIMEDDA